MQNSFHGRTFGAMALTTSKTYYRQGFAPLMPQVVVAPYPYCLHCKVRAAHPEGDNWYKASPCSHVPTRHSGDALDRVEENSVCA